MSLLAVNMGACTKTGVAVVSSRTLNAAVVIVAG